MMAGENGARQVVEAILAASAKVALPVWLCIVATIADHFAAVAPRAANALGPAVLPHQFVALRIIEQR